MSAQPILMSWCPGGKCDPCKTQAGNIWIGGKYCVSANGTIGGSDCILATGVAFTLIPVNPYRLVSFVITYTVKGADIKTHNTISASVSATGVGYYGGAGYQGGLPLPWAPLPLQPLNLNVDLNYPFIKNSAGFFYPISLTISCSGADDFGPAPIDPNLFLEDSGGNLAPIAYLYG